jgi:hypothetical protein
MDPSQAQNDPKVQRFAQASLAAHVAAMREGKPPPTMTPEQYAAASPEDQAAAEAKLGLHMTPFGGGYNG